jgi:hypothetical protein
MHNNDWLASIAARISPMIQPMVCYRELPAPSADFWQHYSMVEDAHYSNGPQLPSWSSLIAKLGPSCCYCSCLLSSPLQPTNHRPTEGVGGDEEVSEKKNQRTASATVARRTAQRSRRVVKCDKKARWAPNKTRWTVPVREMRNDKLSSLMNSVYTRERERDIYVYT